MDLAKVTVQGQITIPSDLRRYLGIKGGDKVVFLKDKGRVIMANSNMLALREVQDALDGVSERMGLENEQDVVALVKEHRRKKKIER